MDKDERPDEPEEVQGEHLPEDAGSADTGADTAPQEAEAAPPGGSADVPREKPVREERVEEPVASEDQAPAEEGTGAAGDPAGEDAAGSRQAPAADAIDTDGAAVEASPGAEAGAPPAEAGPDEVPSEPGAPRGKPRPGGRRRDRDADAAEGAEVIPGAHLEPDLVLEQPRSPEDDAFAKYAEAEAQLAGTEPAATEPAATEPVAPAADTPAPADGDGAAPAPAPAERSTVDLAADARYRATGKRKTAVARVILKPGGGSFQVNGRELDQFFPRPGLQHTARQALDATGYLARMDVVARIHGGGVSAQAGALRHGIARALVEADPNLRSELKRRGFLTRDARAKERRKAGLKKARKRPQFSKR